MENNCIELSCINNSDCSDEEFFDQLQKFSRSIYVDVIGQSSTLDDLKDGLQKRIDSFSNVKNQKDLKSNQNYTTSFYPFHKTHFIFLKSTSYDDYVLQCASYGLDIESTEEYWKACKDKIEAFQNFRHSDNAMYSITISKPQKTQYVNLQFTTNGNLI